MKNLGDKGVFVFEELAGVGDADFLEKATEGFFGVQLEEATEVGGAHLGNGCDFFHPDVFLEVLEGVFQYFIDDALGIKRVDRFMGK